MQRSAASLRRRRWTSFGIAGVLGLAVANRIATWAAEKAHPPTGAFLWVDGVRLHYTDRGQGRPVLLIHGNTVTGEDWRTSGVADLLERHHRVIIIDRPGFGHSSRPRGRVWTADAQAGLFLHALRWLGIEQAVVVGHSWGAVAALAMAIKNPAQVAALVVVSGYYFRTLRPDVLLVAVGALPVLGDLLAHTIAPVLGWLQLPLLRWAVFSPAAVPKRFDAEYSPAMAFRPSQIRGTAVEGALMISSAVRNARHYATLAMPVSIISGDGDKVVFPRSAHRLHAQVRGSTLNIVAGAGHMVHHTAPQAIARAVDEVCG